MLVKLQTSRRFVSSSTGDVEAVCRGEHLAGGEDGAAAAVQGEAQVGEVHQQHHLDTPRPWVFFSAADRLIETNTEKRPTRSFSWLKAPTSPFTFKTLLRHYAKQALTPR